MRISDWSSDVCSSDLPMLSLVAQGFQNIGDHIADGLEFGDTEAARRAGGRSDADAAGLDRRQRIKGDAVLVAGDRAAFQRLVGVAAGDAQRTQVDQRQVRSEEHTSELQSLMRISYAVFCLKHKKN